MVWMVHFVHKQQMQNTAHWEYVLLITSDCMVSWKREKKTYFSSVPVNLLFKYKNKVDR